MKENYLILCIVRHVWQNGSMFDMKKIEKIQKRALRYITNNYASSYTDLLNACNIPPMFIQRVRFLMVEVYKILNLIGPLYLHDMYIRKETAYDMRNILALKLPIFNTKKYGLNSIRYQGAKLWNTLPNDIKRASSLSVFKSLVTQWDGATCSCNSCDTCNLSMV